ncbi:zinc finger domain-containing protein [Mycobacteroides abscessus]|uniref:zinc finger domain-containing protein n=1 Tax=Mycobacteroides abscessus TaxID=36809 RepID=UPI0040535765
MLNPSKAQRKAIAEGDPDLNVACPTCRSEPNEVCYFRPGSGIPNGEGYKHMTRGMAAGW